MMATARTTKTEAPADPAPESAPEGGDSLAETIRAEIGRALGSLLDSGKARVADSADKGGEDDDAPRTWSARDIQQFAADAMRKAQEELAAQRKAKRASQQGEAAPATPPPAAPVEAPPRSRSRIFGEGGKLWGTK
jgi:hypothetical protein